MLTLNCQAILFDLDGTLVDSAIRVQRLWIEWSKRRGIDTELLLEVMHGRRADETIQMVAPHLSVQDEFLALEAEEIADMEGVRPYPSAAELLGSALVSSMGDRYLRHTSRCRSPHEACGTAHTQGLYHGR